MRVDVVIVAFNSAQHLDACLEAVSASGSLVGRVIVVDNASPDDSGAVAARHASGPSVIQAPTNRGFGAGCNLGFRATEGEFVLFLNPDARPAPSAIATLLRTATLDPRIGVVGGRLLDPLGEVTSAAAGAEPSLRSVVGHFLLVSRLPGLQRPFAPVQIADASSVAWPDWVGGGAMLVRRAAFESVGGFDERFFLYMEDVDLCRRVRGAGWHIAYEPTALVEHTIGGSQSDDQPARWYQAFHEYMVRQRGERVASLASGVAAIGMIARWGAYRGRRPVQARRMRLAARTAASLALGLHKDNWT